MVVAVITPALKLPEPSLATTLLAVLADVASTFNVTPPLEPPPVKYEPAVTAVISPTFVVKPLSLLNALKPISANLLRLSAPLSSRMISSVEPSTAPVSYTHLTLPTKRIV